ncbi:MAG: YggT family protein [Actinobacteria bacterium]|nr:YggT family protein [Actinomycetota bacterium]
MCPMPMEHREHYEVDEHTERQFEEDRVAERENQIGRINGIIWLAFGILEALICLRVILKLIGANPENAFANFIYTVSHLFLAPFFGLVGEPTSDGSVLEVTSLVAMIFYLLVGLGITRLIYLLMMPTQVRHERTIQRH